MNVSMSSSTNAGSPPVISRRWSSAAGSSVMASGSRGRLEATRRRGRTSNGKHEHGSAEALRPDLADGFDRDGVVSSSERPLRDQDLAGCGLAAQPGGEDHRVADRAVVVTAFEPDAAQGRIAGRNPDADVEDVAALPPALCQLLEAVAHRDRHAHRAAGVVALDDRIVEERHEAVAGKVLERPLVLDDEPAHRAVVRAQEPEDLLRLGRLREDGEVAQIAEDGGDLAPVAGEQLFAIVARDEGGHLG